MKAQTKTLSIPSVGLSTSAIVLYIGIVYGACVSAVPVGAMEAVSAYILLGFAWTLLGWSFCWLAFPPVAATLVLAAIAASYSCPREVNSRFFVLLIPFASIATMITWGAYCFATIPDGAAPAWRLEVLNVLLNASYVPAALVALHIAFSKRWQRDEKLFACIVLFVEALLTASTYVTVYMPTINAWL